MKRFQYLIKLFLFAILLTAFTGCSFEGDLEVLGKNPIESDFEDFSSLTIEDNGMYLIKVDGHKDLSSTLDLDYGGKTVTIRITGINSGVINRTGTSSLIRIGPGITLVLDNITLNGNATLGPVLDVDGGTLIMNDKTLIKGSTTSLGGIGVTAGGSFIMNGGTISVYTGGHCISINNSEFTMNGGTISGTISGYTSPSECVSLTLNSKFTMTGGSISEYDGIGVSVEYSDFIMKGGAITDNAGNGVFLSNMGSFTMKNGNISGNELANVSLVVSSASFTMDGGSISGKTTSTMGNDTMGVTSNGNFIMNGGSIYDNKALEGGGVRISGGSFTMNNGARIYNNTAGSGGGVVVVNGSFTMESGSVISGNSASKGGGVQINGGTFTMNEGAVISGNFTTSPGGSDSDSGFGGGVCVSGNNYGPGTFYMYGGTISGNEAVAGAGVYVAQSLNSSSSPWSYGIFTMNGGTIQGNTATAKGGGVYLWEHKTSSTLKPHFTKSGGGVIYGNTGANKNSALQGAAVAAEIIITDGNKYRETTVEADQNMSFSGTAFSGQWTD